MKQMLDNRNLAENEPVEAVESPTTEDEKVEAPVEETPEVVEETTEQTTEPEVKPEEEVTEAPQAPKPTRAEKRIRDLAQENRELQEKIEQFYSQTNPALQGEEIGYDDLNKVINERAIEAARLIIESHEVGTQYQGKVKEWADDYEQVKSQNSQLDPQSPDFDPELDATLARLMNDGNGNPRIDIKVSEVLKTLARREANTASKAKEEGKSEVTATLAKQSQEGAITPSSKTSKSEEYSDEEIANIQMTNPRLYSELIQQGKI